MAAITLPLLVLTLLPPSVGLDGTVQIYDTRCWDAAVKEVDALFTHRGHSVMGECEDGSVPRVTVHSWHPWKERTLVSAANDGSLHIWDWLR